MNVVKVQYEIHDVVPESPKRAKSRRPQSAPFSQTKFMTGDKHTNSGDKYKYKLKELDVEPPKYISQEARGLRNFPLPQKPTTSHILRRNPHPVPRTDKPDWNPSLTVPDRDILIINQDLEVARFRDSHNFFEEGQEHKPEPTLANFSSRKSSKLAESEEHRDRWVHHSFGAVANNPLPFYPNLHQTSGIHSERWRNSEKFSVDYDDWAKPALKTEKAQCDFHKDFRAPTKPVPIQQVNMQHSLSSIESTYTKADARIRGSNKAVLHK